MLGQNRPGTKLTLSLRLGFTIFLAIFAVACAPTIQSADLTGFSKASADINKQVDIAFAESNRVARAASVDRFVRSRQLGLTEDQFIVAVSPDAIVAWDTALSKLQEYASLLASLTDSGRGPATSDALVGLGRQLRDGGTGANISPGVATAFASLGGALVDLRAQSRAREILVATDPQVQLLLHQMAAAIGENNREELRGTVWANWEASFQGLRHDYATAAAAGDQAKQRSLVTEYLAALDRRDAQLSSLAALRSSLLTLATAHSAAAAGHAESLDSLLGSIATRLDETKRLYDAFEHQAAPGGTTGSNHNG